MHCNQFHERMNDVLDSRQLPEQDPLLIRHAQDCEVCRSTLEMQRQVFQCLCAHPVPAHAVPAHAVPAHAVPSERVAKAPARLTIGVAAASAALVLLAVSMHVPNETDAPAGPNPPTTATNTNPAPAAKPHSTNLLAGLMHGDFSNLLPEETHLTDNAWLDQVSGGVKPLANSMSSTLNVLRRTWPSAGPRNQGTENSPVEAGTG